MKSLEEIVEQVKHLSEVEKLAVATQLGVGTDEFHQYLMNPKCESLSEQAITRFMEQDRDPDWTVGFVLVASGVLLASRLVVFVLNGKNNVFPLEQGNTLRFNVLTLKERKSREKKREHCTCNGDVTLYKQMWLYNNLT